MFRAALIVLSIVVVVGVAAAQTPQKTSNEIRAAMDARDFDRAEKLVRELRSTDAAAFTANNYDYLLGRLAERRGENAEAAALYLGLLNRNSILAPYALWHLSAAARANDDLPLERQYITRLLAQYSASALTGKARERLIESHRESGDYRAIIALLRPIASETGVRGRSAMARLGEAYSKVGDNEAARTLFNQLVAGSRDDYALSGALGLDSLDRAAGTKPNEFDALRRARIYLFNRHWPEARAHLIGIVERFPDSPNRPEALYQTGFSFYREDIYDDAIKWFERTHTEFPNKKEGEQGYYWVATALQKARRYDEAARRYISFIDAYPRSELVEGAYRNAADALRYADKYAESIQWSRRIVTDFAGKPLATVGLYNEAKLELARGNYETALSLLVRVSAQPVTPKLFGAPIRGEASFLRIYTLEQMGRLAEAVQLYLAIPDERDNYFGHQATERLQAIAKTEGGRRVIEPLARSYRDQSKTALGAGRYGEAKDAANQALRLIENPGRQAEIFDVLRASYSHLPAYAAVWRFKLIPTGRAFLTSETSGSHRSRSSELLFLGLYDEGAIELRLSGIESARNMVAGAEQDYGAQTGDPAYSLAVYSNRGDLSWHAIAFAEPLSKSIPQDFRIELMPRDLAEMIYPAPYRDSLTRYGRAQGVDPRLVLSLARQESRFDPSVKSPASARGLLQFIPETALKAASEEGIKDFELDDVYQPQVAVRLAVRYSADLLKLFPDNPQAVAASYNAGEQSVERWIYRSRSSDVDRMLAEIAIPETKDYVAKVMNNYWEYRRLYTIDLKPGR
jgi:peptidoglycan lytic transglycosylase